MRALSLRAAATCENATSPASKCRCRCGGRFHGSARVTAEDTPAFEALGIEDPHYAVSAKRRAQLKRQAREKAWRDQQAVRDLFDEVQR